LGRVFWFIFGPVLVLVEGVLRIAVFFFGCAYFAYRQWILGDIKWHHSEASAVASAPTGDSESVASPPPVAAVMNSPPSTNAPAVQTPTPIPVAPSNPLSNVRPSFNCAVATRPDELTICSDPELAEIDQKVAQRFRNLRSNRKAIQVARTALPQRGKCGSDARCIKSVLLAEINDFDRL
jgi:hypothetical protein